jgi:hypothetical protein
MSGASPGGVCILCVVPEHDLVFTAFGNASGAIVLQDQILQWLLSEHFGVQIPTLITELAQDVDLDPYVGTYRANQLRIDVGIVDGQLGGGVTLGCGPRVLLSGLPGNCWAGASAGPTRARSTRARATGCVVSRCPTTPSRERSPCPSATSTTGAETVAVAGS